MRYCRTCLMPDTKPYLTFDNDGVCAACRTTKAKQHYLSGIDWDARAAEFKRLLQWARDCRAPAYDVLVPVSGGKDSITQVHRALGADLRILAVNIDYGIKTEIGRRNLACIPNMGANLFVYTPAQPLHKELVRIGFEDFGDPDLLSHTLLHAQPLRTALAFRIPLVLLGENSAFEYGGDGTIAASREMTRDWFSKYAANAGRDARFIAREYGIPYEQLVAYDFPDELTDLGTKAVFMSHYYCWDSEEHLRIARNHGFQPLTYPGEGTYRTYVGIDEKINRIHQYLKVLKFGYGRATDHACEDIRAGRLDREAAKSLVRDHDLRPLSDAYAEDFCRFLDMPRDRFDTILDSYRDQRIWQRNNSGEWIIPGHLVDDVQRSTAESSQ